MPFEERQKLFKEIEKLRQHPLIVYATSDRINAGGSMSRDVIPQFAKRIMELPKADQIDLMVVSHGGDPMVSWRMISMLRNKYNKIGVLLPFAAYSAATLIALGADEIIMHPFSNLGPVDPQLIMKDKGDFGSEDLRHFLEFIKHDVGLTDQEQLEKAFELFCKEVGPIQIGKAKRSSFLSLSLGEKLLSTHMKEDQKTKAKAITEALNKSFFHHGYPLDRKEASSIGLNIIEPPDKLEGLMWNVWEDIESEMKCQIPFDPLVELMNDPVNAANLLSTQTANIPSNLPPAVLQTIINHIIGGNYLLNINPVDFELLIAVLETNISKSQYKVTGKITGAKIPPLQIVTNIIKLTQQWS